MKKTLFAVLAVLLISIIFMGMASADYGYTSVSQIPMAVDFTFSVEFDDAGEPQIVTDYPFEATGATEMVVEYGMREGVGIELTYQYPAGNTKCSTWRLGSSSLQDASFDDIKKMVSDAIRNGELDPENDIWIGTSFHSEKTDWYLDYSIQAKNYVKYKEMTYSSAHDVMKSGSVARTVNYSDGKIIDSDVRKRLNHADLILRFDAYGNPKTPASISQWKPESRRFTCDPETGLFDGKKISELDMGFTEEDLQVPAPAALSEAAPAAKAAETAEPAAPAAANMPAENEIQNYTSVARIPMAVEFTVNVELDDTGMPRIVTDYPFEAMGATEMTLQYNKVDFTHAIELRYNAAKGETRFGGYYPSAFSNENYEKMLEEACQMIRDGVLTLDDSVWIGTTYYNEEKTSWYLEYSIRAKNYTAYEEATFSQGFNALAAGGVLKHISYENGVINDSYILKRLDGVDLYLRFDAYGNPERSASITQWRPEHKHYQFDMKTGLCDGKKISELELGFTEEDLQMSAPAALDENEPETEKASDAATTAESEEDEISSYTSVFRIPMAVDFSVSVEFDDEGMPQIVTDYPFSVTGAAVMDLQYNKEDCQYAVNLEYNAVKGTTMIGSYYPSAFSGGYSIDEFRQMIQSGELTLDDSVWIGTAAHYSPQKDWYLEYSLKEKNYISYEEKTQSQGFDGMGAGGVRKGLNYSNGKLKSSFYQKRKSHADLMITFDSEGKVQLISLYQHEPTEESYFVYSADDLFGGKKISELNLGYTEEDLHVKAPTAVAPPETESSLESRNYNNVSKIPMAVGFTVRMDFDSEGKGHVVTDYPYKDTGATEMNLIYNMGSIREAVTVKYQFATGETDFEGYDDSLFSSETLSDAWGMIRSGELVLADTVCINTSNFDSRKDWFLYYSLKEEQYILYEERTFAQAFNAMGVGAVEKSIHYLGGELQSSSIQKRTSNGDLVISYDADGNLADAYIDQYSPEYRSYDYNFDTGLFSGKSITELGYDEADLQLPAPARLDPAEKAAKEAEKAESEDTADEKLFRYDLNSDGTATITAVSKSITNGKIPAELDGHPVTAIYWGAFDGCDNLKELVLPEGLKKIGMRSIGGCTNLLSVTIPDSVEEIEEGAFDTCFDLSSITISPTHPYYAFNNGALISKKDMTLIKFASNRNTAYEVSWGIRRIGTDAFNGSKVTSVILPDSVTEIGQCAFAYCYNLEEIFIPEGVKVIGSQAFMDCGLEAVSIPDSVEVIESGVFNYCDRLKTAEISPDHPVFEVKNQLLIDKNKKSVLSTVGNIRGVCEIPDGIVTIEDGAFLGCTGMTEIYIPDSVKMISSLKLANSESLVVRAHEGTWAEKYCQIVGLPFKAID